MNKGNPGVGSRLFVLVCFAFMAVLPGCATVLTDTSASKPAPVERVALKDAAAALEKTPWPTPTDISMSERLTGIIANPQEERITRKKAVAVYVASLQTMPNPSQALMNDADAQLRAADKLALAAVNAAEAIRPSMSDVAILEGAIGALRTSREVFLASVSELIDDKDAASGLKKSIKSDFSRAIKEIGDAADVLADRAAADKTRTMATPVSRNNLTGSL